MARLAEGVNESLLQLEIVEAMQALAVAGAPDYCDGCLGGADGNEHVQQQGRVSPSSLRVQPTSLRLVACECALHIFSASLQQVAAGLQGREVLVHRAPGP